MFGDALPEEVLTIATDLDMTGAQERWDTFAAEPGAITTDAIIAELREDYERLKAIDCLHREPESLPEGENPA